MNKFKEFSDAELLLIKFSMRVNIDEYERGDCNSKTDYLLSKKLYDAIKEELESRGYKND